MGLSSIPNAFSELFDIASGNIDDLIIKENSSKTNCFIYHSNNIIGGFLIINKPNIKTILNVTFYKSKSDNKYIPRLEFRKENKEGNVSFSKGTEAIVRFSDGDEARNLWKVIGFLQGFKGLVDVGDFHSKYQAISFENYLVEFKNKAQADKLKELSSLTENLKLSNEEIKKLLFPQRRNCIHWFYALLKDLSNAEGIRAFDSYRIKNNIKEIGEEAIWHHFLKSNDWIIGLNVQVKFIRDLLSEQQIGSSNTKGKGSPKVDLLGLSYFTTLIELKTSKTSIFKEVKTTNSRTNTWDFSNDFIEAFSQTLSQRTEITPDKNILDEENKYIDTKINRILDPKAVLIIGNRNTEFPHKRDAILDVKSDCFERFRRDSRNVEVITYDELFERAFHIVFTEKIPLNWFNLACDDFKKNVLKV